MNEWAEADEKMWRERKKETKKKKKKRKGRGRKKVEGEVVRV